MDQGYGITLVWRGASLFGVVGVWAGGAMAAAIIGGRRAAE
jgi:hypothetical protein